MDYDAILEKVEYLQNAMISFATNDDYENEKYEKYRIDIINEVALTKLIPKILKKYRSGGEFWPFIKTKFAHYQQRRVFIYEQFRPLINFLETSEVSPADNVMSITIENLGQGYITEEWNKALLRRNTDPKGAITIARTLLETTCKYILDEQKIKYKDSVDLPVLYNITSKQLNLSPAQHTDDIIKQILGGCFSIVQGIGALRNKISDAYGQGIDRISPYERHAMLTVNAAGTLATFLLQTFENKRIQDKK
ncbi:abortive infection family protein [Clostridium tyrobutyricum]|uniref:abortive infection family protein n=1 Tax=Clostridium tyrobutyricum TaxID=1519 RepID=UPI000580A7F7|nr:abortive infection family protein [Clostridium tyrobutyricum]MBR9648579.1 abortive infection family protein [Clostridium tyrobutyricum]